MSGAFPVARPPRSPGGRGATFSGMRHADAGYPKAIEVAKREGVRMPMLR
ncbi:MAG: hypothetical protein IPI87_20050 [Betaproteobacteria bacterium]|nr:hypothetical protein [Betaproteobacteria bacterium]